MSNFNYPSNMNNCYTNDRGLGSGFFGGGHHSHHGQGYYNSYSNYGNYMAPPPQYNYNQHSGLGGPGIAGALLSGLAHNGGRHHHNIGFGGPGCQNGFNNNPFGRWWKNSLYYNIFF